MDYYWNHIFFLIELYVISHTYESEYGLIKRDSNNYRKKKSMAS